MDWLKRMNSVLAYIENNLDDEIDDNKITVLSAIPKGMFQRIFAIITDMTLSEYIRKRRLTQSVSDIRDTNAKIIDIAVRACAITPLPYIDHRIKCQNTSQSIPASCLIDVPRHIRFRTSRRILK